MVRLEDVEGTYIAKVTQNLVLIGVEENNIYRVLVENFEFIYDSVEV